jgi:hypothetical protein
MEHPYIVVYHHRLPNVRIFEENTTFWCPDREEHGYYITPTFKCITNPRIATAHRWAALNITTGIDRSTGMVSILL